MADTRRTWTGEAVEVIIRSLKETRVGEEGRPGGRTEVWIWGREAL